MLDLIPLGFELARVELLKPCGCEAFSNPKWDEIVRYGADSSVPVLAVRKVAPNAPYRELMFTLVGWAEKPVLAIALQEV